MPELADMLGMLTMARRPGQIIGWRLGRPVEYEEFLARVSDWRALLIRTSGQAFALYIDDGVEFASALFGAWASGKTIYLPGDKLPGTCAHVRETVHGYLGEFPAECTPLMPAPQDQSNHADAFDRLNGNFVGLVLFTSGSTGAPKAIPKELSQMSREVATLESQFGDLLGAADVMTTVSHQHIYGLLFNVLWPLTMGRMISSKSFSFPQEFVAMRAQRDCLLVSSPAHLKRLPAEFLEMRKFNRLRAVFSSGGPLSFEAACETKRLLGRVPIEVYGSSETGGIAWRQQLTRRNEAWTPLNGVTCRINPEECVLEVRSPHLPDNQWFRTADRVDFVGNNHFLLKGRVDRIVKLEEKRISLTAIERHLILSPMVMDARVLVVEGRRPRTAAFVVPSVQGHRKLVEVGKLAFNRILRDVLSQSIEQVGIPRVWRYLDALPVNAQGKTTHAELIALLDDKPLRPKLPFQRILEKNAQRAVLELAAPHELVYFNGHFPDMPILPGVAQVHWALFYGRQCFDLPAVFRGIHALKFQRIIAPEKPFLLELVHETKSSLSFKITSREGTHASGRLMFEASDV
jgi:3-hydroxymyristoyl/3-hydroxydecanoyl-(acyl carrier protein) dehydratase